MKTKVLIIIMATLTVGLFAQKPMSAFMGIKWGTNVEEAKPILETRLNMDFKIKKEAFLKLDYDKYYRFVKKNISIGFLDVKKIVFKFMPIDPKTKRKKNNYDKFLLESVIIRISSYSFNNIVRVLKKKYGSSFIESKSRIYNLAGAEWDQYEYTWIDKSIGRVVEVIKYRTDPDKGALAEAMITFKKYNPKDFITRSDIEELANIF